MSIEFIDARLSDAVSYGFRGAPRFNTRVAPLRNSNERRNGNWQYPLHEYQAEYELLKEELQTELLHAIWVARGQLRAFRFKDWNDFEVSQAEGSLAAPATTTTPMQLTKTYTFGSYTEIRNITLPLAAQLYADGVAYNDYTLDPLTGLATPTTAWPAASWAWSGDFDVRVRFAEDYTALARARPRVSNASVRLLEVRR